VFFGCSLGCGDDEVAPVIEDASDQPGDGDGDGDAATDAGGDGDGDAATDAGGDGDGDGDGGAGTGGQLAITADMANGTLSIVDIDLLAEGGTRADALVDTIDLSDYTPGPMSLAITPDGKTALVSMSVGFLNLIGAGIPTGEDKLLIIDIASRTVTGEIAVGAGPMGIAITHDSKTAFVGLLGQTAFAIVDIENQTFETVETGATYNEELAIDDSGEVAILSYGVAGDVKTFSVDDPAGTLGGTTGITGDGAGVAFFPGTKMAFLVQAPTPLTNNVGGHDVIDVTDPTMPVASDNIRIEMAPTSYPVATVHARSSVAYPAIAEGRLTIVEMKLEGDVAIEVQTIDVGPSGLFAYGISATNDGRVLVAEPGTHTVSVVDLESGTGFSIPWEGEAYGPTEIKVIP
jgi:DNA-binding beta-propeller fold protein YncE